MGLRVVNCCRPRCFRKDNGVALRWLGCLVSDAKLWVLDEPLTALDVGAVALIQDLIAEHLKRRNGDLYHPSTA